MSSKVIKIVFGILKFCGDNFFIVCSSLKVSKRECKRIRAYMYKSCMCMQLNKDVHVALSIDFAKILIKFRYLKIF